MVQSRKLSKEEINQFSIEYKKNGFEKIMLNLWRSEFFGLAGEVIPGLNPYERELGVPIIEPVIVRNVIEANKEIAKIRGGGQSLKQAVFNWTK